MADVSENGLNSAQTTSVQKPRLFGYSDIDTTQIVRGLERQFEQEQHRVVLWHDPDREFTEIISALKLDAVNVIRLDETAGLAVKIQVERTDPTGRYLLYMPFEEPAPEHDWLLDMRLYGSKFRADRASMLLAELGLGQRQSLSAHLNKRLKFLNNKERMSRLAKLVNADASMVFVGSINQSVDVLVKTRHLLAPFPATMIDTAFFDRFHAYVPGWEIPKMRPEFFTNRYGLIVD